MTIIKRFISIILLLVSISSKAQTHTFLGELKLGYVNYLSAGYESKIPHRLFVENWKIKVYIQKANGEKGEEIKTVKLLPKEQWYTDWNEEIKKVEVVIEVADNLLHKSNGKVIESGNMNLIAELWSINPDKYYDKIRKPINISWWKHNANNIKDYYYITENTFKLSEPISIGSPAIVGLKLALAFVNMALDSTSNEIPQYNNTVRELESFLKKSYDSLELSYFQFSNFSKLLIFIEPYVSEGSFLNLEAKELYNDIQDLTDTLNELKDIDKMSESIKDSIIDRKKEYSEIFLEYQTTINRLRKYYANLQLILYGKRFRYNFERIQPYSNQFQDWYYIKTENKSLTYALGSSFVYGLRPLYNVTLSDSNNIVQFESISKFHIALTGGIFWSPNLVNRVSNSLDGNTDSISKKGKISIGLLLTYTIVPNASQLPRTNPLGLGLAIGYKKQNLGIYFTSNFNVVKQPRQYFIDQYKDKNISLNSLDINDSRIFINKTEIALGISLVYFINNKSRTTPLKQFSFR